MSANIKELHKGPQYQKTKSAHGKQTATKQAVAIATKESRKSRGDPSIGQKRKNESRKAKIGQALMDMM